MTPNDFVKQILTIVKNWVYEQDFAKNNVSVGTTSSENWELIIDDTIESSIKLYQKSVDINGKPFSLKKAFLLINGAVDGENATYPFCVSTDRSVVTAWEANNTIVTMNKTTYSTTISCTMSAMFEKFGDTVICTDYKKTPGSGDTNKLHASYVNTDQDGIDASNIGIYTNINTLQCASYGTIFLPGCRIRMWGIRE